ncbi:MAG: glutaminyl-tRNA synthase (glutamine-hydrolyzing) subunit A [Parcubacteria group bacterium RIFCSPHIGHO2_01_FULL_47_10b]|nr:MAG: glutaminyl-tRNA synthase (glutamine-hydrolyzing) subunit A [Parcubacteria group bacterium RIFCSPHIGHO2_01_FULL_47_10b]
MSNHPRFNSIRQTQEALQNKQISCEELTRAYVQSIDEHNDLNAFISVCGERAIAKAKETDSKIVHDDALSGMEGVVLGVKDNILVKGLGCTAGSKILASYTASYTATAVNRLEEAGAIVIGKTNLDQFGMGSSSQFSYFGGVKNPVDPERVPGGSSGGSAAAVKADMCLAALGTDMGGSCRQPASFCGVFGYKPSYGLVSRHGLLSSGPSLDQVGVLAHCVEDIEVIMGVMAGQDGLDANVRLPQFRSRKDVPLNALRIGVPEEFFTDGLDDEIKKAVHDQITMLKKQGATITNITLPHATKEAIATYYIIMPAECSSNLARFDGVRYGTRIEGDGSAGVGSDVIESYLLTREDGFGAEVKRRILLGTFVLSAGYADRYYVRAQQARNMLREGLAKAFREVDIIITPTTPNPAFPIGSKTDDPTTMYLEDIYTVSANLAGIPAISMPCGLSQGLPVGMQIWGRYGDDATVLAVARQLDALNKGQ